MSVSWTTPFSTISPYASPASTGAWGAAGWTLPDTTNALRGYQSPLDWARYGYNDRPSSYGYSSFDPVPRGESYDPVSNLMGWGVINSDIDQWLATAHPELFNFNNNSQYGTTPTSLGGDWAGVDQWDAAIQQASQQTGVPANLIKAVMKLESGGQNLAMNGAGAVGPMQVVASIWSSLGYDLNDPVQNIMAGATILKQNYDQFQSWAAANGVNPWKAAVYAYYAGSPYDLSAHDDPAMGGSGMSTADYGNQIWNSFQQLQFAGNPSSGSTGPTPVASAGFEAITGGMPFGITQEMGLTDFAQTQLGGQYAYGSDYGVVGHAGIDVGTPLGTRLFTPVSGTVVYSGGTGYYTDYYLGNSNHTGELLIKLDNGDELILGHMQNITVNVGDRVTPGQYVGDSGFGGAPSNGGGPHVHVEYRQWKGDGSTPSGFQAVDPRVALSGSFVSSFGTPGQTNTFPGFNPGTYTPDASQWSAFMRQASLGLPLYGTGVTPDYGGSAWSSWLKSNSPWIPGNATQQQYTGVD